MNKNELENQIGKILNELKRGGRRVQKTGLPVDADQPAFKIKKKPGWSAATTPPEFPPAAPLPVHQQSADDPDNKAESDDDDRSIKSTGTDMSKDSLASGPVPTPRRPMRGNWTGSPQSNPRSLSKAERQQADASARLTLGKRPEGSFGPQFIQPKRLNPKPQHMVPIPVSTHAGVLAAQGIKPENPVDQARRLGLGEYKQSRSTPTGPNLIELQAINNEKAKINGEIYDLMLKKNNMTDDEYNSEMQKLEFIRYNLYYPPKPDVTAPKPKTTLAHVAETPLSAYDAATRPKTDDDLNPKTAASKTAPIVSSDDFADTSKSILKYNDWLKDQIEQTKQQNVVKISIDKAKNQQMHQEALVASAEAGLADAQAKLAKSIADTAQERAKLALINAEIADKKLEAGLPVVPEVIKAAADEQVFPPEPPPIYQPSDNIAASAVAFAAAKETVNYGIDLEDIELDLQEIIDENAAAQALAQAAAQERLIINESAAAQALAQAAAQERPIINESAAANAIAQAAAQEPRVIEQDETAAANALAQAAAQERRVIEQDETAAANALARAAAEEQLIIEPDETAAAQALAQAAISEAQPAQAPDSDQAAAQALARAAVNEAGPAVPLPIADSDQAAAQAVARAAVNEAGPIGPLPVPDSDQAAAQAIARAAVNEAGPAPPAVPLPIADSDQAAAQAIARAAVNEAGPAVVPPIGPIPDSDQAAAQAIARAAVNEAGPAPPPGAPPVAAAAAAPLNLLKAIYDALTGMFPPVYDADYEKDIKNYREKIFAELKTKIGAITNEKITENIRLILRKPKDANGFFCVFHIHRDYLEDDANKKKLMPIFKLYTADFDDVGAMTNFKIYEDP
jgi:hypothetical protein